MSITSSQQLAKVLEQPHTSQIKPLGQILLEASVITPEQLREAILKQASVLHGERLGRILERLGHASAESIQQALAERLGLPFVNLFDFDIEAEVIETVPVDYARKHVLIPLMLHRDRLIVALEDPTNAECLHMLHFITGQVIEPVMATREGIEYGISQFYGPQDDADVLRDLPTDTPHLTEARARELAENKPTVRLVNNLIFDAIHRRASDIHIRPCEKNVEIFFRVDGSLIKIRSVQKSLLAAAVSRIKIIGGMNIAEHRLPQDGRTKMNIQDRTIDLRLSIIPTIYGESVVIRILDTSSGMKTIDQIGFSIQDAGLFTSLIHKSTGMLLVTGPTGSGKSTTLYAALQEIRKQNINIITVEDPVEYHLDGILQIQVHPNIEYTFARALRHILRHDPDAIMVGEIRDQETAKMAVESALTGHLVLSTLHTNSAATTITRLLEIGIDAYLLNATLLAVLAQRLIKKNCVHCLEQESVSPSVRHELGVADAEVFYRGRGCEHCHGIGYSGRMAVYEFLPINRQLREMIQPGVQASELETLAIQSGMLPLTQRALQVAREKITSLEEVYRVRLG